MFSVVGSKFTLPNLVDNGYIATSQSNSSSTLHCRIVWSERKMTTGDVFQTSEKVTVPMKTSCVHSHVPNNFPCSPHVFYYLHGAFLFPNVHLHSGHFPLTFNHRAFGTGFLTSGLVCDFGISDGGVFPEILKVAIVRACISCIIIYVLSYINQMSAKTSHHLPDRCLGVPSQLFIVQNCFNIKDFQKILTVRPWK